MMTLIMSLTLIISITNVCLLHLVFNFVFEMTCVIELRVSAAAARAARVLQHSHHAQTRTDKQDIITSLPEKPKSPNKLTETVFGTLTVARRSESLPRGLLPQLGSRGPPAPAWVQRSSSTS